MSWAACDEIPAAAEAAAPESVDDCRCAAVDDGGGTTPGGADEVEPAYDGVVGGGSPYAANVAALVGVVAPAVAA